MVNNQMSYQDFAILYRTNMQSRIFEEALRKRNIPYKIYGGLSFYQRKEVKDLIAYFRMVVNPDDSEALKRIINYPARGIGSTTLGKIEANANLYGVSLWKVICNTDKFPLELNKGTLNKIGGFTQMIQNFIEVKDQNDAYDLAQLVASESGLLKDLNLGNTIEERSKYENVEELLNGIRDYATSNFHEGKPARLEGFLENVALLTDQDKDNPDDKNRVTLMTIHAAKGLEFPHVYIVGMEEELFPSGMSVHTQKDLEEERRLFYVAITRAEQRVTLSYCKSRYKYGTPVNTSASRFINEIEPQFIKTKALFTKKSFDQDADDSSHEVSFKNRGSAFKKPIRPGMNLAANRKLKQINQTSDDNFAPDASDEIKSGMNVEHQQFGAGRIVQIDGDGNIKKAVVFFPKFGEKKLLLRFARLRIIR
jgi:DNA helicase-2/ATP-dependent DNA helicase PcrA